MKQDKLSNHYTGNIAGEYEQARKVGKKWQNEDAAISRMISSLPSGMKIIDVPVGTGRFFDVYASNSSIVEGVDISKDMLHEAENHPFAAQIEHTLCEGSIFDLNYPDNSFDLALCIRFLNLVNTADVDRSLAQLSRVSNQYVIAGIRHLVPVNEMNLLSFSGFKMFISQTISRISNIITGKIEFHTKQNIHGIFKKHDLHITDQDCIQKRADGTDYYIYLLENK